MGFLDKLKRAFMGGKEKDGKAGKDVDDTEEKT